MSRDASGNYSLPLADVVTGDTIEASWANTTLDDVATELQDSLSRSGKGNMSVPFKAVSGTVSAPGYAFSSEANSGYYRSSAGDIRFTLNGADQWRTTASGLQINDGGTFRNLVPATGNSTIAGVKTFSSDPIVPDEVYGAGWDGSLEPPTKNAVYDRIQTLTMQAYPAWEALTLNQTLSLGDRVICTNVTGSETWTLPTCTDLVSTPTPPNDIWIMVSGATGSESITIAPPSGGVIYLNGVSLGTDGTFQAPDGSFIVATAISTNAYAANMFSKTPYLSAAASASSVTPTVGNEIIAYSALAAGLTINNPANAYPGWRLTFRIKDDGTSRSFTWGSQYRGIAAALPTATTMNKLLYMEFVYNTTETKFDLVLIEEEP